MPYASGGNKQLLEVKNMMNFDVKDFVTTELNVNTENFPFFFNNAKRYIEKQNNDAAFASTLLLGLALVESNKEKMSFYEEVLGRKIEKAKDIVAFTLAIQLQILEAKVNEELVKINFYKIAG